MSPLTTARRTVAEDVWQSYPELTEDEAVEYAVDHVDVEELDWNNPNAWAYQVVLLEAGR